MNIYLNSKSVEINTKNKEKIIENIKKRLEDEIIEIIYLDEVEVSLNYFLNNNLELDRFDKIKFISKKVELLIKETLNQAEEYLPRLKTGIKETTIELRNENYQKISELIDPVINGLEWYLNILNSVIKLREEKTITKNIRNHLKKFNLALNRVMIAFEKESYENLADLLDVDILSYLDTFIKFNKKLLDS